MNKYRNGLFPLCFLAYSSIYVARLNLTAAAPYLQDTGALTGSQLGSISSAFLIVYALGRLFNGALCDRLQPRHVIFAGSLTIGICNLLLGMLPCFPIFCLLWGINGYAQSLMWGPVLRTVCAKTSAEKQTTAVSILGSSICVGNVVGLLASSFFIEHIGVRCAFLIPGCFSIVIAIVDCLFFRCDISGGSDSDHNLPQLTILQKPSVRKMILPATVHGIIKDNINVWAALFFATVYQIDTSAIPLFVFAVPITGMVGRLICPVLCRIASGRSELVNTCAFVVCALAALPLTLNGTSAAMATILLCILSASVQVINNSVLAVFPSSFQSSGNVSQVAGWMDFFTYLGAGISSGIFGHAITHFSFNVMFGSWVALSLIAILWLISHRHKKATNP